MRLSEAIRLGAMLKPQGFASLLHAGHTCAIGAALDACGRFKDATIDPCLYGELYDEAVAMWPVLDMAVTHPEDREVEWLSRDVVWDLNDSFQWSRERIADLVETWESQMDPEGRAAHPSAEADPLCAPPEIQDTTSAI